MTVLVTGFEALDDDLNASKILVESLRDDLPKELQDIHQLIRFEIIPASTKALSITLLDLFIRYQPEYCIFIGQAPGRNRITFERVATNLKDFRIPDIDGNIPRGELIESDGPAAYWSNLPDQGRLIEHLNDKGIPAGFSNYGGNHLCNQILYHGLHIAMTQGDKTKCGFIHIPALPIQVQKKWFDTPFIPLSMAREAVSLVLTDIQYSA